VKATSAPETSQ